MIEIHYPSKGDLPEPSGEMRAQRKPVLAYTKSLGWTQAVRRQVKKINSSGCVRTTTETRSFQTMKSWHGRSFQDRN